MKLDPGFGISYDGDPAPTVPVQKVCELRQDNLPHRKARLKPIR
jgi:hypothetical protein